MTSQEAGTPSPSGRRRRGGWTLACALSAALVTGCGSSGNVEAPVDTDTDTGVGETLQLVAANYPLQYILTKVAGPQYVIETLTPQGEDPHGVEPPPEKVDAIGEADLVLVLKGFQPGVDTAVAEDVDNVFDVAPSAQLVERGGTLDPHFWLDVERVGAVADAVADQMGEIDSANELQYQGNAASLKGELRELDAQVRMTLVNCDTTTFVTEHQAFGYFAEKYGLTERPITGPMGAQPSEAQLDQMVSLVEDEDLQAVYSDPLDSTWADTVADRAGVSAAVLDPVESVHPGSTGADLVEIMRTNLETLGEGQGCDNPLDPGSTLVPTGSATEDDGSG